MKKYNSLASLRDYKKQNSEDTDITNETKNGSTKDKSITPIKKQVAKNFKQVEEKSTTLTKTKPIERINLKVEQKYAVRNVVFRIK
jgi:hypothetical protein